MSISIFISTKAINRLIRQVDEAGVLPDINGRLGRSDFLHACYSVTMPRLPQVETCDGGVLKVHVPAEGTISIPWGMGTKFKMEATTGISMEMEGSELRVDIGELTFDDLCLGNGCSFPRRVLQMLGPFLRGMLLQMLRMDDGQRIDIPAIEVPLSMVKPDAKPMQLGVMDIEVQTPGIVALVGMEDDASPPASLPPPGDWDITVAVCEGTAEDMAARAMEAIGDIEGKLSFTVPDTRQVADLLFASAETLTTFGRRGLGRRALRSASRVEVSYTACVGRPNLSFGEGDRVILCKIPAHVCARAELVVEHFKGGILDRLRAFLRPSAEKHASQVESTSVGSWDIDGDFVLERAELTVIQQEGSIPKIEVTLLDLEMDLPWPLPNELLEKVAEGIGKDIISARLPSGALPEVPLPPEMPFKVKIEDIKVSTCSGRLLVQANIGVVPEGDPTVAKQMIEGRIRDVIPSGL